ncbi:MAG TPA: homoserine O-acetyltransferase [Armatimonadota bacterium]|jgi:homoserine O-acetyltransferase
MATLFGQPRPFPESGLTAVTRTFTFAEPPDEMALVCGGRLGPITVAYQTYGTLNEAADNGVLVCHSLTGDMHAAGRMEGRDWVGWWDPLIGPGRAFDTDRYFVVCASVLGGNGGTTAAMSLNPRTGRPYGSAFPEITMRDIVNVHAALLNHLGVQQLAAVSGPSMGGSQTWEFAVAYPDMVRNCIPVASAPIASGILIAWNAVAKRAFATDPNFQGGDYYGTGRTPDAGLSLARQIATITYYSASYLGGWFGNSPAEACQGQKVPSEFAVEEYLTGEGEKLVARFDANAYLSAIRVLETMDVGRAVGGRDAAMKAMRSRLLVVGVASDMLFPPQELRAAVAAAQYAGVDAHYEEIDSEDGHDACLLEIDKVGELITAFLKADSAR